VEIADRDVQQERRRLFWQRVYLQALEYVVKLQPLEAVSTSELAADHADEAVARFDDWETSNVPAAQNDSDREFAGQDDPADPYLGARG